MTGGFHLAVALDGAGFHPAAWREPSASPDALFSPGYWIGLAETAERGLLDFLTIEDSFGLQSSSIRGHDERTDQVRGRLDAVLIASLLAPRTRHIGLVPTAITTHPEPFHLASALSTLDWTSKGRAGWRAQVSFRAEEFAHVGTRPAVDLDPLDRDDPAVVQRSLELFEEAADVVEVVRRLWDSWEDDAIIKDVATGRFVDRDKLHYVDFDAREFSVRGPSIVPRPPQGQPLVTALAHQQIPFEFAARAADVVYVTPTDRDVERWVADVRAAEETVSRAGPPLLVFADLNVLLDVRSGQAASRKRRLDDLDGAAWRSDAAIVTATPVELAELLADWHGRGVDGFRLRPGVLRHDLAAIVDQLVPVLQRRGAFRTAYEPGTLRSRLGLARPANRYAAV